MVTSVDFFCCLHGRGPAHRDLISVVGAFPDIEAIAFVRVPGEQYIYGRAYHAGAHVDDSGH